jgi:hypothetical protein
MIMNAQQMEREKRPLGLIKPKRLAIEAFGELKMGPLAH